MFSCFNLEFLRLKIRWLQAVTLAMIALEPQCGKAPSQQLGLNSQPFLGQSTVGMDFFREIFGRIMIPM